MSDCSICDHAKEHGWWGPQCKGTHCSGCHRSWTGFAEGHCPQEGCHRHFAGVKAFDAHLREKKDGTLEHRDPPAKSGFRLIERASGPTWGREMDDKALKRLTRNRKQDGEAA